MVWPALFQRLNKIIMIVHDTEYENIILPVFSTACTSQVTTDSDEDCSVHLGRYTYDSGELLFYGNKTRGAHYIFKKKQPQDAVPTFRWTSNMPVNCRGQTVNIATARRGCDSTCPLIGFGNCLLCIDFTTNDLSSQSHSKCLINKQ